MIWLYWLRLHVLCCTTICHYKFILIISFTTEIYKSYTNVSLRIYLTIKRVRCSGRRRTCFFFFKMWVHEGITWILYWFKITLLKHMLTMIWHIYEKDICLFFYYTDNFERHMTLSFLMSKYLKKFYCFSILFWTVWYPKHCQHHTLSVFYSFQKCANEIWHYLFARLNILRFIIFCYKTNLINYDIMYI